MNKNFIILMIEILFGQIKLEIHYKIQMILIKINNQYKKVVVVQQLHIQLKQMYKYLKNKVMKNMMC